MKAFAGKVLLWVSVAAVLLMMASNEGFTQDLGAIFRSVFEGIGAFFVGLADLIADHVPQRGRS